MLFRSIGGEGVGAGDREEVPARIEQRLAGADAFQQQVAGHFEQEISDEEDARAETIHRVVERQGLLHLQLRIADIDAVQIRDHIGDQQQRDDAPIDFREDGFVKRVIRDR